MERGFPEIAVLSWTGAWVRKETPEDRVTILEDAYKEAANHESVITLIEKAGPTPDYIGREELLKIIPVEEETILAAAKAAGISQN
jgi:tripartite-type tricarboxylate transporter receptor subunit TctC